ncbi:MAG: BrnT family toxin [Anaerolineae bacterium]|nr:BrnT family toxin [Anaerolineae bacterium]
MRINRIIWYDKLVEKLWDKHHVEVSEAEEVVYNYGRVRRVHRGHVKGEDVYLALGQTDAGRHLAVFFVYKRSRDTIVISARDMDPAERREYERAKQRTDSRGV